jgi:hypothetical protein
MCSSLGYHTFSIAYVNGKLSIEALSCWSALKLWISMFEVHTNMHKSVCETIPLEGPEVLCRCAFGVKGGIEVGGLRKDWSIGRARRCNLWGRMLAYGGVKGPCYYFVLSMVAVPHVQQSQKHSGFIPRSGKGEKTMKRKRNRGKEK